jgi:hypothetical protein
MYRGDFPGILNNYINNLMKVRETKFPAGLLEGQSPSILFPTRLEPVPFASAHCTGSKLLFVEHLHPLKRFRLSG